jgi:hypothetical protein
VTEERLSLSSLIERWLDLFGWLGWGQGGWGFAELAKAALKLAQRAGGLGLFCHFLFLGVFGGFGAAGAAFPEHFEGAFELAAKSGLLALEVVEGFGGIGGEAEGLGLGGFVVDAGVRGEAEADEVGFDEAEALEAPLGVDHLVDEVVFGGGLGLVFGQERVAEDFELLGVFVEEEGGLGEGGARVGAGGDALCVETGLGLGFGDLVKFAGEIGVVGFGHFVIGLLTFRVKRGGQISGGLGRVETAGKPLTMNE